MSKLPIGQRLIVAVFACLIDSAFTFGFNLVLIPNMKQPITDWLKTMHSNVDDKPITTSAGILGYTVNPPLIRLLHAFIFIGSSIGGLLSIRMAKKVGRKGGLLMTSFISAFAALFAGYSKFFESSLLLFIGCFLIGIKIGISSSLGPLYLMEISPNKIRVRVTGLFSLFVTVGVLASFFICKYIGNKDYWPLVFSLNVIPAVIQLLILPSCPESPKYLSVIKGKELEAKNALKWLRGDNYNEEEINELRAELYQRRALGVLTLKDIVNNDVLLHALLISTMISDSSDRVSLQENGRSFERVKFKYLGMILMSQIKLRKFRKIAICKTVLPEKEKMKCISSSKV
ncbi:facilitated glucose transporter protein 1-like [Lycorma delicatula]|uniref:facilitated glucose transporter protein 1-like n=1 Tax=Lycorma delicatula TaxID=130591 RepID=UPI003F50D504